MIVRRQRVSQAHSFCSQSHCNIPQAGHCRIPWAACDWNGSSAVGHGAPHNNIEAERGSLSVSFAACILYDGHGHGHTSGEMIFCWTKRTEGEGGPVTAAGCHHQDTVALDGAETDLRRDIC